MKRQLIEVERSFASLSKINRVLICDGSAQGTFGLDGPDFQVIVALERLYCCTKRLKPVGL